MEMNHEELVLLYLYEMDSYDYFMEITVPTVLTVDAACLKCGIGKEEMEAILKREKKSIKSERKSVKGRETKSDCLFLTSKGVTKSKQIKSNIMEMRIDYINENSERQLMKLSKVKSNLEILGYDICYTDLYLRSVRDGKIDMVEFIEKENWKTELFKDHAYPDSVFISNTSCIPFGGIFTIFGEPGLTLPVNKTVEIGLHPFGEGNLIRWMKRQGEDIVDAYYIEGKKGFQSLVSGHSDLLDKFGLYSDKGIFKDEEEYRSYFEILKKFDYSIIFSGGTGHGISMAGHIGTILAAIAIKFHDCVQFPLNGMVDKPRNSRLSSKEKVPVWDFPIPNQQTTLEELISERHEEKTEKDRVTNVFLKFATLAQVFERHWNTSFSIGNEDIVNFQKRFDLKEYSSGGACLTSSLSVPTLLKLDEKGRISMGSVLYPEMALNNNIGLIIDHKGGIDNPKEEFIETFYRFYPLIRLHSKESLDYFSKLKSTSGSLAKLASKVLLEDQSFADPDSTEKRRAICALINMQRGIYSSLGIENYAFKQIYDQLRQNEVDIEISPVGVGNSGTYFFCVPDNQSSVSFRNTVDRMNMNRIENERLEAITHGSSHLYIFNIDPLIVIDRSQ